MDAVDLLKMVCGAILVLFIPGLPWTFVFLHRTKVDMVERIALSFGLSIALVPLFTFLLNRLFGMGITILTVTVLALVLTAIPIGYVFLRRHL